MKKVLFAASECVPFVKTGGLADVVGALPKEFDQAEWDIRVLFQIIHVFHHNIGIISNMYVISRWEWVLI